MGGFFSFLPSVSGKPKASGAGRWAPRSRPKKEKCLGRRHTTTGPGWTSLEHSASPPGEEGLARGHRQDFSLDLLRHLPAKRGTRTFPKQRYLPVPQPGKAITLQER